MLDTFTDEPQGLSLKGADTMNFNESTTLRDFEVQELSADTWRRLAIMWQECALGMKYNLRVEFADKEAVAQ